MSGTSIVSRWHLVSFRVPIVSLFHHILHISSTVISATVQAEVAKTVDDSHGDQQRVCFVHGWSAQMEAIWMEAKWMDGGKQ